MDFLAVLDQVRDLLRQRGRVTYRVLKRQFGLDDEALEDLKEELIYGQKIAADEDGRVLVLAGTSDAPPVSPAPSSQPESSPSLQETHILPSDPAPATPRVPEAERRQLTVEFCDLVGSTALSGQLDPEDLREVVRAYQEAATTVIQRYEGHIAQYLGDGLLIYSGYPQAHEDDAHRAIRIGLGIVEAITHLNPRLEQRYGIRLAVRVGIHTGLVVVGDMGGSGRHEQLALGETPNIAARLEGLADANQVVISAATQRLVGGAFDLEDLGAHAMKGVAEPMQVYGIQGERAGESRFDAATVTGLTPLVGREEEVGLVLRRWEQAKEGEGQVVLLCGEPGIGKSRLTQTLREQVAEEPHIRLRYQCSPYYTSTAFYPIITQLEQAAQFARHDTPDEKLDKLETLLARSTDQIVSVASLFAALLEIPSGDRYPPMAFTPQKQKELIIEVLIDQLEGLARQQPVLFIWEDAHWSDATSLEVLDLLMHRVAETRTLVVMTYRPAFEPPWREFAPVTLHTLNRLTRRQGATLVTAVTGGKALPDEVLDQIIAKTDGVPLFVEELTKMVLESGLVQECEGRYELTGPLPSLAIPSTLQDSLMARLDRLSPVKEVAQIGACIGREFSYELLAAVSPLRDDALQDALRHLGTSELIFRKGSPPSATYTFKHALVQETAYASLLKSTRQQLHTTIARALEQHFPGIVGTEPELAAHHYTAAGLNDQAIPYWLTAGQQAVERFANAEALNHLEQGLRLLHELPDDEPRDRREIPLQVLTGMALLAVKGFGAAEVGKTFTRAHELCEKVGDTQFMFPVYHGLWLFYMMRAEYVAAGKVAQECLAAALATGDSAALMLGYWFAGGPALFTGDFARGLEHSAKGTAAYDPEKHRDLAHVYGHNPGPTCMDWTAWVYWMLGYPDTFRTQDAEALERAREVKDPMTLATVLVHVAVWHSLARDVSTSLEHARETIALCHEVGIPLRRIEAEIIEGWALAELGEAERGITEIEQAIAAWRGIGTEIAVSWWLALLAQARHKAGRNKEAFSALHEAFDFVERTNERAFEAELHRLQGDLLLKGDEPDETEAETAYAKAVEVAKSQQAKSWELRAATSLSCLWRSQGETREAYDLLAPVYHWFTEGFDTADLQEAKALLKELEE